MVLKTMLIMTRFVFILTLLSLVACHKLENTDPNKLIFGLSAPPLTLDPRLATDATSQRLCDLIFSSLIRNGPELKATPQAAISWVIGQKKIDFKIRKDLRFHNGRLVNLNDIVYSINEFRKPSNPAATSISAISRVEITGDDTISLILSRNDGSLFGQLNEIKILPREEIENPHSNFALTPVGSGPYRLVSWDNNQLTLEKSSGAPYALPQIRELQFRFIRDETTRFLKILNGDIDILSNDLQEDKVKELQKSQKVHVLITPGLNVVYVLINLKNPTLGNLTVRQALFSSLDRVEIIKYKLDGFANLATAIIAPSNPYFDKNLSLNNFKHSNLISTLKSLGLDSKEISFKSSDLAQENGLALAHQWNKKGLKIKFQAYEWGTFYNDVKTGNYELALLKWVGIVDPDVYRDTLSSSEFPPGRNRGYYSNKKFDDLVNKARETMDFRTRQRLYNEAQRIIAGDMPVIPLWYNDNIHILSRRIKNFVPHIAGSFYPVIESQKE